MDASGTRESPAKETGASLRGYGFTEAARVNGFLPPGGSGAA